MAQIIISALLVFVLLAAIVLLVTAGRREDGMTKKQKKNVVRIFISAALLLVLEQLTAESFTFLDQQLFPSAGRVVRFALYFLDYWIIGHDILAKAWRGIQNKRVFDENFLMAVATVGAMTLAIVENGDYLEAIAVMLFYQIGEWFQS